MGEGTAGLDPGDVIELRLTALEVLADRAQQLADGMREKVAALAVLVSEASERSGDGQDWQPPAVVSLN
jgi:hypothetical protein